MSGQSVLECMNASAANVRVRVLLCTPFQTQTASNFTAANYLQAMTQWSTGSISTGSTFSGYSSLFGGTNFFRAPNTSMLWNKLFFTKNHQYGLKIVKKFPACTIPAGSQKRFVHKCASMKFGWPEYAAGGVGSGGVYSVLSSSASGGYGWWAGKSFIWVMEVMGEWGQVSGPSSKPQIAPVGLDFTVRETSDYTFRPLPLATLGKGVYGNFLGPSDGGNISAWAVGGVANGINKKIGAIFPGQSAAGTGDTSTGNFGMFAGKTGGTYVGQNQPTVEVPSTASSF